MRDGEARTVRYGDWGTFLSAVEGPCDLPESDRTSYQLGEWSGCYTRGEAMTLAHHGWTENRPEVTALVDRIKDDLRPMMVDTFASYFDVAGSQVDVDRYLMGEPENMVNLIPVKIAKPGRVISILVNIGALANVSADQIIKRGVAICGLIECLELLQHSTELWVSSTVGSSAHRENASRFSVMVKIKAAEDKLDMDRVMFAIAHPAMLRRCVFSIREQQEDRKWWGFYTGGSYGWSTDITNEVAEMANATLTMPLLTSRDRPADPEQWIKDNLSEFGLLG